MASKLTVMFVIACCVIQLNDVATFTPLRIKRQAPPRVNRPQSVSVGVQSPSEQASAMAIASASASTSSVNPSGSLDAREPALITDANKNTIASRPIDGQSVADGGQDNPRQPLRKKPSRVANRRPPAQPVNNRDRDEEDEECYDEIGDYDYGRFFTHPMRQIRNMMNNVFDRMPMQPFDADYGGPGLAASSSAFSGRDGFSRMSSMVSNNGRTRGIISETRNGRTQTRRIGNDDDDDDYAPGDKGRRQSRSYEDDGGDDEE